jgi:hypothetical protein
MSAPAWRHVQAVRPELAVFRCHQHLDGWSEELIRELIEVRTRASGVTLDYSDLVIERPEGVSEEVQLSQSAEGYCRLLWDYTDGNPKAAVHLLLRSLVQEAPSQVKVRLFRAPPVEELAHENEEALFLLSAIVTHNGLSTDECQVVTRLPGELTTIHLERLQELGVLSEDGSGFRISTAWHRPTVRMLRRNNLLAF